MTGKLESYGRFSDLDTVNRNSGYVDMPGGSLHNVSPNRSVIMHSISPTPKKRATSLKKPKRRHLENVELEDMRPRTSSLPSRNQLRRPYIQYLSPCSADDDVYTCRSFVTTSKGVLVNRGDSLRSRSTNSIISSGSGSMTELTPLSPSSSSLSQSSLANSTGSAFAPVAFRVLVLGSPGVGKTSVTQQFMTSEYLGGFDASIDGERERTVSVILDGVESSIAFLDSSDEMDWTLEAGIDAYVLLFSIDDRATFEYCTDILFEIRKQNHQDTPIILVANKCDLVRTRAVGTEEAKSVASTYDCKYIETSVVLNHNVDELLAGIVCQMRLRCKTSSKPSRRQGDDEHGCYSRSKTLLTKIFKKDSVSKSCDNLYVL